MRHAEDVILAPASFVLSAFAALGTAFVLWRRGGAWDAPLWLVLVHPAWWMTQDERFRLPGSIAVTVATLAFCVFLLRRVKA
jgi:hypothetical protein